VLLDHLLLAFSVLLLLIPLGREIGPLKNLVFLGLESEGEGTFRISPGTDRLLGEVVVAAFAELDVSDHRVASII
jgi:hypothetical protein